MKLKYDQDLRDILPNDWTQAPKGNVKTDCIWCGKSGKLYIQCNPDSVNKKFKPNFGTYHCKSCERYGGLYKLLAAIGKVDLIEGQTYRKLEKLSNPFLIDDSIIEALKPLPTIKLPAGFKRSQEDEYLNQRRLSAYHYKNFICGRNELAIKPKDYVYLGIPQNGSPKAYIKRRTSEDDSLLRYDNSRHDFSRIVTGLDEIDFFTNTIIITEGLFDKVSIDNALNLTTRKDTKCIALNGKNISESQLQQLLCNPNIKRLIFALDIDAIDHIRSVAGRLLLYFDIVDVATLFDAKDWGDAEYTSIVKSFNNTKSVDEYRRRVIHFPIT